jgi:hypothetical protein
MPDEEPFAPNAVLGLLWEGGVPMNSAIAELLEDAAAVRELARMVCEHTQRLIDDFHCIYAQRRLERLNRSAKSTPG